MTRLLACASGTTLGSWLRQAVAPQVPVDHAAPEQVVEQLGQQSYAGIVLVLGTAILKLWPTVRARLVADRTPAVLLTSCSVESLRLLAFERELRLIELHIIGFDDHPAYLRRSLERLLSDRVLQELLHHFGSHAADLERLLAPAWSFLAETRSVDEWAARLGRDSTTLSRQLRALGVRSPRRLLSWLRLLSAWPRLQAGHSAARVALEVGYSAPPAFTRCTREFVGITPSSVDTLSVDGLISRAAVDLVA